MGAATEQAGLAGRDDDVWHPAGERGKFRNEWLDSHHTFSFGEYHNPQRMGFGTLRVLNDDTVAPAKGFATHPHRDMEIVSIPISGALQHKDSVGNSSIIRPGEVQSMSAGTGIEHSEWNPSGAEPVHFLQIWILPRELSVQPRYAQWNYTPSLEGGRFAQIVCPLGSDEPGIGLHQNVRFWMAQTEAAVSLELAPPRGCEGVYFFVIDGSAAISGRTLGKGDGLGRWTSAPQTVATAGPARVLAIGVTKSRS